MTDQSKNGHEQDNGQQNGQGHNVDKKLQSPGQLDFKKADKAFEKILRENQEWLKEMANR